MSKLLDWSRPRTWVIVGLVIAVVGAVLTASSDDAAEVGRPLVIAGWVFVGVGFLAFVITQVRKGVEAGRDE